MVVSLGNTNAFMMFDWIMSKIYDYVYYDVLNKRSLCDIAFHLLMSYYVAGSQCNR